MQLALSDTSIRFYQPHIILFVKTGARIYAGSALKINGAYQPVELISYSSLVSVSFITCFLRFLLTTTMSG